MSKQPMHKVDHQCMACQCRKTGMFFPVYRSDGKFAYWRCQSCHEFRSELIKERSNGKQA